MQSFVPITRKITPIKKGGPRLVSLQHNEEGKISRQGTVASSKIFDHTHGLRAFFAYFFNQVINSEENYKRDQ